MSHSVFSISPSAEIIVPAPSREDDLSTGDARAGISHGGKCRDAQVLSFPRWQSLAISNGAGVGAARFFDRAWPCGRAGRRRRFPVDGPAVAGRDCRETCRTGQTGRSVRWAGARGAAAPGCGRFRRFPEGDRGGRNPHGRDAERRRAGSRPSRARGAGAEHRRGCSRHAGTTLGGRADARGRNRRRGRVGSIQRPPRANPIHAPAAIPAADERADRCAARVHRACESSGRAPISPRLARGRACGSNPRHIRAIAYWIVARVVAGARLAGPAEPPPGYGIIARAQRVRSTSVNGLPGRAGPARQRRCRVWCNLATLISAGGSVADHRSRTGFVKKSW